MTDVKVLTPTELRIFMARHDISQDKVAEIMGYKTGGGQIIGAYCREKADIPKWESWLKLNEWEKNNGK